MSHLEIANQSYEEHFYDSMGYCLMAMEAGIYFFIHALFPDTFTSSGSQTVKQLYEKIEHKMRNAVAINMVSCEDAELTADGTVLREESTGKEPQR